MQSCIYEGTVRHRRFRPTPNAFQYRVFFMYLDLAELPHVFDCHPLWSAQQPNMAYLRRKDHFGNPRKPIDLAVRELVAEKTGRAPEGPIRMLTHLRYFGYCFNPASFYYCYDALDSTVETIVVEIHNTPWGEVHCYVLNRVQDEHPIKNWRRHRFAKVFHVSPFMGMDMQYHWRIEHDDQHILVHIENWQQEKLFDATLSVQQRTLTSSSLFTVLKQWPVMTLTILKGIYWQALKLFIKKVPYHSHP